jgi:hypothetical protein
LLLFLAGRLWAMPSDLRVLTDELTAPGMASAELQAAHSAARATAESRGAASMQGLLELSAGLAPDWELSLQLPADRTDSAWAGAGANLELMWVAPHDDDEGAYWGWRAEIGRSRVPFETSAWAWEWRPILGVRVGDWHGVVNAGLSANAGSGDRRVRLESAGKLSHSMSADLALGLEAFVGVGPLSRPVARSERSEVALLVLDRRFGPFNLNVGVGKGFAGAVEGRVIKVLLAVEWDSLFGR